ncbi:bifunctional proline dehydrogenase/L-glutamate gamma-semialdehyde dehydrogenase PutA [Parahaliea sp. F7430]|uniref:Bifunctional protein PutA n=1 Tax=Sediminihaliea albiluteola TaxID=2758564 RepID=A0A7W2TU49_9GAMM|nr:bifunctional proline dehydrogenase/L-glutamate gamma-semialdehyde dehydrogenase PutA [Sediminihaliea albiluteola]MBA6412014.1 bifunctional proline dehydrogenase/L-glutamate gamma-semialdehyde dehydrogenase PutA [Sediminihaliea albiluteola]
MLFTGSVTADNSLRTQLRSQYREDEDQLLDRLLAMAQISHAARSRAWQRARKLVLHIRAEQSGSSSVDALLQEYALSSEEGVLLMCLAEALLRIPDQHSIERLIRDKLSAGNWSSHRGNSPSLLVNASTWALLLSSKVLHYNEQNPAEPFGLLQRSIGRLGEALIRSAVRYAMQKMGSQFVMGSSIDSAMERAKDFEQRGYRYSYDMLGEGARNMADADRYFANYMKAIEVIGRAAGARGPVASPGISLKLSAIHPRYEFAQRERLMEELVPRLKQLALAAKAVDIGLTIDAEEADRLDLSLDIIEAVFSDSELAGWSGFGIAVQAYQKRSILVIEWLRELSLRVGRQIMVRLVKGAYWDSEIKQAQVQGFDNFPVFTRKASSDVSYQACAAKLLEYRDSLYPQFATHNAYTVASILEMCDDSQCYEFQRLHGMGEALYDQIITETKVACRVYAPVGVHAELLAYLVRRLLENGANSSFVNNIVDQNFPIEALLEDPVEQVRNLQHKSNPYISLPGALYGSERANAKGIDLGDPLIVTAYRKAMNSFLDQLPLDYSSGDNSIEVRNPAEHKELIGRISFAGEKDIDSALDRAHAFFPTWSKTPLKVRAELLRKLADALEQNSAELIALCCKEAGKTLADAVAEVREAVDFCRYYASLAEQQECSSPGRRPRGVVLCISPWNFPLAIFIAQVCAALVTGNTVVAKPAEQTSLIAILCAQLAQDCGLPAHALQLLISPGLPVGERLLPDKRIKAVMFTGSTKTATWLYRSLAQRPDAPLPLIAETGGLNCMIVDSTALPEQAVDDIISSGFHSAGQRCSALRVLFLQEEIADKIIAMTIGAMDELHVGDPAWLKTDIGPVIDARALERLNQHVQYMSSAGRLLHTCAAPVGEGHKFFAPRLYEISDLSLLKEEVFGPIVHVIRYRAEDFHQVIEQINHSGYGLTFGIHSRIDSSCQEAARLIQAGNIYVNRNMIGAIVGVQPFGGRGLSGTGPKAGGPHYLSRLVSTAEEVEHSTAQRRLASATINPEKIPLNYSTVPQQNWAGQPVNTRLSVLRQFIARYTLLAKTEKAWQLESVVSAAHEQLRFAGQYLAKPTVLAGPTGESNTLILEARGRLCLLLDSEQHKGEYLIALISVLVAGNSVLALAADDLLNSWQELADALKAAGLPEGLFELAPLKCAAAVLSSDSLDGVLLHPHSHYLHDVSQRLAQRSGAITALICTVDSQTLLQQNVLEKTISIDTTAAGGNASLLTLPSN